MKFNEINESKSGLNNLGCLVRIEKTKGGLIYFIDSTKDICKIIKNQKELDTILENNKF